MTESITLKNNIPIISFISSDILTKRERKLSKFFRCCPTDNSSSDKKCFWTGNDVQKFRQHIQSSHRKLVCSYCLSDKSSLDPTPEEFAAEDVDRLIEHLSQCHGRRQFQCNRCPYRAISLTHIQFHHMSNHFEIWSKKNRKIDLTFTSIDDPDLDICKIIDCKPIIEGPKEGLPGWLTKKCPDLDIDLDDNKYYCLHCGYSNEEVMKVIVHNIDRHRDLNICVYHKENEPLLVDNPVLIEEESQLISSDEDSDEESEPEDQNLKPLVKNFDTKLSLQSNPIIPGLDGRVNTRPMTNGRSQRKPQKAEKVLSFSPVKNEDSNECFFNDDFEVDFEPPVQPIQENFVPQTYCSTPLPAVIGNHNIGQIFGSPFETEVICPLEPTPVQDLPEQQVITNDNKKKKKSKKGKQKLKPNETFSGLTYRQYKEQKRLEELKNNPNLGIPPPIDLRQTEKELKQSGLEKNTFKQIKRVGVSNTNTEKPLISYHIRDEEEEDSYVDLIAEKIPKRGMKARFEAQRHFELINLQNTSNKDKNLWKCIICSNDANVVTLRETAIRIHLEKVHKTNSSLKCGFTGCALIGDKQSIISHSKIIHPNVDPKIEKFIVPSYQDKAIGISGSNLERKTTARKSTASGPNAVTKGAKGSLTQRIKESTYLGPLRNDKTIRKRSISGGPYERVYNRGTHSSDIRSKKFRKMDIQSDSDEENRDSEVEMESDYELDAGPSETVIESPRKQCVARKSTAKPSSGSQNKSIILKETEIPVKYFCVFCSEGYLINDMKEAIEHYKGHLQLGYKCNGCHFFCVSYQSMAEHWSLLHMSDDMDFEDNMPPLMNNWIIEFLENQIKLSNFTEDVSPNETGINIMCPLCVKAAKICNTKPKSFEALWKAKLHICSHMNWMPKKCTLCPESHPGFPNQPYILMKHLVEYHFTSVENLYNISFRGQKAYNDMKREQLSLISKHYTSARFNSSQIVDAFFNNLMIEFDVIYENQLKAKHNLNKEIQIRLERCVVVKTEPMDFDHKTQVKDEDKKDVKLQIKSELKSELKTDVKDETKSEIKTEFKEGKQNEGKKEVNDTTDGEEYFRTLYGSTNRFHGECIDLSSDDD